MSCNQTVQKSAGNRFCLRKNNEDQTKVRAPWWNDNVKEAIKDKKKLYKAWVRSKLEEDYIKCRLARLRCKRVLKEAKEES